jgi:hypothetical protein
MSNGAVARYVGWPAFLTQYSRSTELKSPVQRRFQSCHQASDYQAFSQPCAACRLLMTNRLVLHEIGRLIWESRPPKKKIFFFFFFGNFFFSNEKGISWRGRGNGGRRTREGRGDPQEGISRKGDFRSRRSYPGYNNLLGFCDKILDMSWYSRACLGRVHSLRNGNGSRTSVGTPSGAK